MRRIMFVALAAIVGLAIPASAGAAKKKKKHHATPTAIKTGTYKAKAEAAAFNIVLSKAKCAAPGQTSTATHLCVSLPEPPEVECTGAVPSGAGATPSDREPDAVPNPSRCCLAQQARNTRY